MHLRTQFKPSGARLLLLLFLLLHPVIPQHRHRHRASRNTTRGSSRPTQQSKVCSTVINEVNIDSPRGRGSQFIEIIRVCNPPDDARAPPDLKGYKLVILRGHPVEIVFVADLNNKKFTVVPELGSTFVLAGASVQLSWQMNLTDPAVQSAYVDSSLPLGDECPYGILLMHAKEKRLLSLVSLNKRNAAGQLLPRPLNFDFNIMRSYTVDMIVYGRKATTNRCTVFEKIFAKVDKATEVDRTTFAGEEYVFRDWDNPKDEDYSINRCTSDTSPFLPRRLRLGKPSPGATNDCSGVTFFIEHHLPHLVLEPTSADSVASMEGCEPDAHGMSPEKYRDLPEGVYHQLIRHEMGRAREECATDNLRSISTAMDNVKLVSSQQTIVALGQTPRPTPFDLHRFEASWVTRCKADFPFNGEALNAPTVQSWLEIEQRGGTCFYSCYYCKFYFSLGFRADIKHKKQICTTDGYHSTNPTRNKDQILQHMKSTVHQEALNLVTEMAMASSEEQRESIIKAARDKEVLEMKVTLDHIFLSYTARKAGVSFAKHPVLVANAKQMGVNLGIHHFHEAADQQKTEAISAGMHSILLNFLVRENKEFSLIVDGSTDNTNVPFLICYIQSFEDGFPMVYFYRLVELADGESAESMFSSFKQKLEEDDAAFPGFVSYFKSKIVAVATDGANVMIGSRNSFLTKLRDYVNRHVASVWCFAHKLNLGIQKGLQTNQKSQKKDPDFWYFKYFEGIISKFYTFYMSWGSKTWQHLNEVAGQVGLDVYRIRYFFNVRWSSSHYEAIRSIKRNYKALVIDLTAIGLEDSEFREESKGKAEDLYRLLTDQHVAFMLSEYSDFLYLYMQVSKAFQGSEGLLVAKAGIVEDLLEKLGQLKLAPGKFLQSFLDQTSSEICGKATTPPCTVETYFTSEFVVFDEVSLVKHHKAYHFPTVRPKLYDSLIAGIKSYFNLPLLKSLQMFDPSSFQPDTSPLLLNQPPNAYCRVLTVSVDDWKQVCEFFYAQPPSARRGITETEQAKHQSMKERYDQCFGSFQPWKQLASAIASHDYLRANFRETTASFWFLALKQRDLPWAPTLEKIVRAVLVTPFGSSDCERGFSILNNVKYKATNRLTPATIQDILRVKINGPEDVTKLKAEQYAREFLKKHARPDDTSFGVRRKNLEGKSFRKESRLF